MELEVGNAQLPGSSMEQNTDCFSKKENEEATATLEAMTEVDCSSFWWDVNWYYEDYFKDYFNVHN